jgi:hypothetical protein
MIASRSLPGGGEPTLIPGSAVLRWMCECRTEVFYLVSVLRRSLEERGRFRRDP